MTVILNDDGSADGAVLSATVSCFDSNSCDDMTIVAGNDSGISLTVNVYEHSESITVNHTNPESVDFECGNVDDERYCVTLCQAL